MTLIRRSRVVWKRDGPRTLIMAGRKIFSLNRRGSEIWEGLEDGVALPQDAETASFLGDLKDLGLVEEVPE